MMPTVDLLHEYVRIGFALLPVKRRTKRAWLPHGEAICNLPKLRQWQRQCAGLNGWAVVPGETLVVLDVENDGPAAAEAAALDLPMAPKCLSGSNKRGFHLYFTRPRQRELRHQVWIRAGLIEARTGPMPCMLPPSVHADGGRYAWAEGLAPWQLSIPPAPAWLLDAMRPLPKVERAPVDLDKIENADRYIGGAIRKAVGRVVDAAAHDRNNQLNRSAFDLARFLGPHLSERDLTETMLQAGLAAGLEERETLDTIRSALAGRRKNG